MSIVTKEQLDQELVQEDNKIMKTFGKNPLSDSEKDDAKKVFTKSLDEEPIVETVDFVVKKKVERLNKSIKPVELNSKDLSEFDEWETEAKKIEGWS